MAGDANVVFQSIAPQIDELIEECALRYELRNRLVCLDVVDRIYVWQRPVTSSGKGVSSKANTIRDFHRFVTSAVTRFPFSTTEGDRRWKGKDADLRRIGDIVTRVIDVTWVPVATEEQRKEQAEQARKILREWHIREDDRDSSREWHIYEER